MQGQVKEAGEATTGPGTPSAGDATARAVVTGLLLALPALMCFRGMAACAVDPDVGWQVQTGVWMLRHHAFPHSDPFSRTGEAARWQAYSWLFDLILLKLYEWLGLAGLVAFTAAMSVAITAAIYRLVSRVQRDLLASAGLTAVAVVCISRDFTPRSWLFTILFFALELDVLLEYRRKRRARILLWLLPMYAVWANVHIQFIDGLLMLGIAACEPLLARWAGWGERRGSAGALWLTLAGCVAATLLNPYGAGIYADAWTMGSQAGVLETVTEMHALAFRSAGDYLLLFLALAATALLFRRKRPEPFETLLLAMGAVLSFRTQRDAWILAIVAAELVARELGPGQEKPIAGTAGRAAAWKPAVTVATAAGIIAAGAAGMQVSNARLEKMQAEALPVQAVQAVEAGHYSGPLFNDYNWGGFLIWKLGWPVAIDGRAGLYGDESIDRSVKTWAGAPGWSKNPELASAGVVIGPVDAALTQLLRMDSRFRLVYEDKLAAVFVASRQNGKSGEANLPASP